MGAGQVGGVHDLVHRHGRIGQGDVLAHRAVEQQVLLQHHAHLPAQPGGIDQGQVHPVHQHAAALGGVQALDQLGQGGFARSRRSDHAQHLSRRDLEGDVAQHLRAVGAVAEGDPLQGHAAGDGRQVAARGRDRLDRRVQDVAQPRHRQPRLLEVLGQLGQAQDRPGHLAGQHVEGDQFAHRQVALDHQPGAEEQQGHAPDLVDQLDGLRAPVGQHPRLEARLDVAGQLALPAVLHLRLDRQGLERLNPGHRLDQEGLVLGASGELLVQPPAQDRAQRRDHHGVGGQRQHHDQQQLGAVEPHHRQEDEGEQKVEHRRQRRGGQELADVLQLAHPGDGVAHAARLEVAHGQLCEMAEQLGAELGVDPACGVGEQIGAQAPHQHLEGVDHQQAHSQHLERRVALVHQDLVDHDLEEQRRDQADELQEQRGDQHVAQQAPVLDQGRDEPADVEGAGRPGHPLAGGHQQQLAREGPGEVGEGLRRRRARRRIEAQHAIVRRLKDQGEAAILEPGDRRQGPACELFGARLDRLGFHAEPARLAEQVLHRGRLAAEAHAVTQLFGVGWPVEKAEQGDETGQACIDAQSRRPRRSAFPWRHACLPRAITLTGGLRPRFRKSSRVTSPRLAFCCIFQKKI